MDENNEHSSNPGPKVLRITTTAPMLGGKNSTGLGFVASHIAKCLCEWDKGYQSLLAVDQVLPGRGRSLIKHESHGVEVFGWNKRWLARRLLGHLPSLPKLIWTASWISRTIKSPFLPIFARVVLFYTIVKEVDPPLLHATGPYTGLIAGKLFSKERKVVISFHCILVMQDEASTDFDKVALEKACLSLPAQFIFVSKGVLRGAKAVNPELPEDACHLASGCFLPGLYSLPPSKSEVRQSLDLEEENIILVTAAKLSRLKGQKRTIQAIASLPEDIRNRIKYLIIGQGPDKEDIEDAVRECAMEQQVEFLGLQEQGTVAKYFQAADAVIVSSSAEGFGLPMVEAQSCGTPPVASATLDASQDIIAAPEHGVLTDDHSPESIAKGILAVLDREWDSGKLYEKAQEFNVEAVAMRFRTIYETILNNSDSEQD